jgi:hypothetical protein
VELALELYRDHEAVKFILDHLSFRKGHERIALALGKLDKGPYVILTKNGHFVTCLGEGMSTGGLDIVPRERVDELMRKNDDYRGRAHMLGREKKRNEQTREFFDRLMHRAGEMTREEFVAFSAFAPLVSSTLYWMSLDAAKYVATHIQNFVGVEKISPQMLPMARSIHDGVWNTGHCILLATLGEKEEIAELVNPPHRFTFQCALMASSTIMLRGAWAASRAGKVLIPDYERCLRKEESPASVLDALVGLLAIGFRDESLQKGIRRILEKATVDLLPPDMPADMRSVAQTALDVLNKPTEELARAVLIGRNVFFQATRHLPNDDPHRFEKAEDIPEDIAATMALSVDVGAFFDQFPAFILAMTPLVGIASAQDFYFPREIATKVSVPWVPEYTLEHVRRTRYTLHAEQEPVKVEKVGRNEPCPCGSGKKYKKCHGA